MRRLMLGWLLLFPMTVQAEDRPMVERFLHAGEFDKGEQALQWRLEVAPADDQARFGLGVLQVLRASERFVQGLHEYGAKGKKIGEWVGFPVPVPDNPEPSPITYQLFRRLLDNYRRDLDEGEATLAAIRDEQVKLQLRLADITFDLDHNGKPTDKFLAILKTFDPRNQLALIQKNPELQVTLDRGDVAWLRAYCHLLMGTLDGCLGLNYEAEFNLDSSGVFANPKHGFYGDEWQRSLARDKARAGPLLSEPVRWHRMRLHLIQLAKLTQEAWGFIGAETDDDAEWLPNVRQQSLLSVRIDGEKIVHWVEMWKEMELVFSGQRTFPLQQWQGPNGKQGELSLKMLFDDPPVTYDTPRDLPDKYFTNEPQADYEKIGMWWIRYNHRIMPFVLWFD